MFLATFLLTCQGRSIVNQPDLEDIEGNGLNSGGATRTKRQSGCSALSLEKRLVKLLDKTSSLPLAPSIMTLQAFTPLPIAQLYCTFNRSACHLTDFSNEPQPWETRVWESFTAMGESSLSEEEQPMWHCETDHMRFPSVLCTSACISTSTRNCTVDHRNSDPSLRSYVRVSYLACKNNDWILETESRYFHSSTKCVCIDVQRKE